MKVIYYIIHNSHAIEHVNDSLESLTMQNAVIDWAKLIIKNSIPEQIPNDAVKEIIKKHQLENHFKAIEFAVPEPVNTTYNDLKTAIQYAKENSVDFLLFTKAEYCYSINAYKVFKDLISDDKNDWVFTPPIVNVTEIGSRENISHKLQQTEFIATDQLTGYDGDDSHRLKNSNTLFNKVLYRLKLKERPAGDISNRKIDEARRYEFIAHNVVLDINVHLFDRESIRKMDFSDEELNLKWGRIRSLDRLLESGTRFIINHKCFAVHLFHEIPGARLGRNIRGVRY